MAREAKLEVRCYRYVCPECGMSDTEVGHLASADEVHCFVCLVDEERHVVLRRWHIEEEEEGNSPPPSGT